mmetsp:Transcript_26288/g.40753  ORF Transcript_26288/g.40753 Transcript_26288/m.40753 type:complete len:181 (+) Transcript_26288:2-544(+)
MLSPRKDGLAPHRFLSRPGTALDEILERLLATTSGSSSPARRHSNAGLAEHNESSNVAGEDGEAFITEKKEGATAVKVDPPSCTHSNNSAASGETKDMRELTVPVTAKEFRGVGSSNSSSRRSKQKGVVGSGRTSGSSNNKNDDLSNHSNSRQHDASMTKKKQQQVMKKEEEEDHRHQLQ